jgi:hypothetical protein
MSDEYTRVSTPSTEDVREYFAFGDFHTWSERVPDRYELFDRWLAEHDRQVGEKAVGEHLAEPAPWVCEYCAFPFPKELGDPGKWSSCEICNSDEFVPNPEAPQFFAGTP